MPTKNLKQLDGAFWASLRRRLAGKNLEKQNQMLGNLFSQEVYQFFTALAHINYTNTGYLVPAAMTTAGFIIANCGSVVQISTNHQQVTNTYVLLVGPPSTGKSAAIKHAVTEPITIADKISIFKDVYIICNIFQGLRCCLFVLQYPIPYHPLPNTRVCVLKEL